MKLYEYYKIRKDGLEDDIADNYIDFAFCFCISEEDEKDTEFKNMADFTVLLMKKTEIECINGNVIICKFSDIINNNMDLIKKFIRENWTEEYQYVLEEDAIKHDEFHYEVLKEWNNVITGNYGEKMNKKYLELLKACK